MERSTSREKSHIIYHRVYADPPARSEIAPSQLTDEGLPHIPPPPPKTPLPPPRTPSPPTPISTPPLVPAPASAPLPPTAKKRIRLVCISDTHNRTIALPAGDVLIHAGDLTNRGGHAELLSAVSWLAAQPHELKIVVAGNHDGVTLDSSYTHRSYTGESHLRNLALLVSPAAMAAGIVYLAHAARTLQLRDGRRLRVFGSPLSPESGGVWGFTYPAPADLAASPWAGLPANLDVLITHTPPKYHLDSSPHAISPPEMHRGCPYLRQALSRARPAIHVFGHIHEARGVERITWDLTSKYVQYREVRTLVIEDPHPPESRRLFIVDTIKVPMHSVRRGEDTLCVNASVATGSWKRGTGHPKVWNRPVVIDMEVDAVEPGGQDGVGVPAKIRVRGVGEGWNVVGVDGAQEPASKQGSE